MITIFTPMLLKENGDDFFSSSMTQRSKTIWLGFLLTLYPLGQFLSSPVLGSLSDRLGRKNLLLNSLAITTLAYAVIAYSLMVKSFILLLVFSFVAGLSEGNIVIAQNAIADVVQGKERDRFFGYIYLSASAAYVIGPLLGGKVAAFYGHAAPFWSVCVLLIVMLFWIKQLFQETLSSEKKIKIHFFGSILNIKNIFYSHIRLLFLINFLIYLGIFGFFRCYPIYLVDEFGFGLSILSEYIAWVAVPIILVNFGLTGFLTKFFSIRKITIISALLTGIFMILVILFNSPTSLWFTLFFTSFVLALCLPACATLLSLSVSGKERGKTMGSNQSLQVGSEALSGLIGGLLAAYIYQFSLLVLGLILIIASLLLLMTYKENSSRSKSQR